jgi:hypothetical protein
MTLFQHFIGISILISYKPKKMNDGPGHTRNYYREEDILSIDVDRGVDSFLNPGRWQ